MKKEDYLGNAIKRNNAKYYVNNLYNTDANLSMVDFISKNYDPTHQITVHMPSIIEIRDNIFKIDCDNIFNMIGSSILNNLLAIKNFDIILHDGDNIIKGGICLDNNAKLINDSDVLVSYCYIYLNGIMYARKFYINKNGEAYAPSSKSDNIICIKCKKGDEEKIYDEIMAMTLDSKGGKLKYFYYMFTAWLIIQLSLIHPEINKIITNKKHEQNSNFDEVKTYNKSPVKKIKAIKNKYINYTINENTIKEVKEISRHTNVWFVSGHYRRYKNGKTIFIQPYWKGPLKDIKMPEPIKAKLEIK